MYGETKSLSFSDTVIPIDNLFKPGLVQGTSNCTCISFLDIKSLTKTGVGIPFFENEIKIKFERLIKNMESTK